MDTTEMLDPVKNANDTMELISQFVLASIEKLVRSF